MGNRQFWVYILASASGNAMYIGVTNNLENRLQSIDPARAVSSPSNIA